MRKEIINTYIYIYFILLRLKCKNNWKYKGLFGHVFLNLFLKIDFKLKKKYNFLMFCKNKGVWQVVLKIKDVFW